jgi:hypothetical protein
MPAAPRAGTMLLLCVALVATASIIAFGFVATARDNMIGAETLTRTEMARAAARMGARHAMEVAVRELSRPYSTGEWSLGQFGHLDRDVSANSRPWGMALNQDGSVCTWNDSDDNVRAESVLFYLHHAWFGDQGVGQAYRPQGNDWPWASLPDRSCAILNPCIPRWIEPGYYNLDGLAKPVRFTQEPASTPERNQPNYFDARWRPVASRAQARYRLRYAVAAMDLGGHFTWGHQLDFDPSRPYDDPSATPFEWDEYTARTYQKSFVSIIAKAGINEANSSNAAMPRTSTLTAYLGRGTSAAHSEYNYVRADRYLVGFGAGPVLLPFSALGVFTEPGSLIATSAVQNMASTGGPMSWYHARSTMAVDAQAGWWTLWTCSPFGRTNRYSPTPTTPYESSVDTPWRVNLLTAPANTIKYMLMGYVPQVALKFCVTQESKFAWDTWVPGANWWDAPKAKWQSAAYVVNTYSPPGPGGPSNPAVDVQTQFFSPPSIAPTQPFAGFNEVNYASAVTPTTYATLYPGPAEDWEDYAALELDPSTSANDGSSATDAIHTRMLGTRVNVWHWPDSPIDSGKWAPGGDLRRRSLLATGGSWTASLEGAGNRDYTGLPAETMRGSAAFLDYDLSWGGAKEVLGGDRTTYTYDTNRRFYHRDSYWLDVLNATAAAISLAKGIHQDASRVGAASVVTYKGSAAAPAPITHIRDVDRSMLAILGEWFPGDATAPGSTTCKPDHVIVQHNGGMETKAPSPRYIVDWTVSANIAGVKGFLTTAAPNGPAMDADQASRKSANMERVLNDWRMSFFGANPTYGDFAGLDFDGDGAAVASFYSGTVTIGGKNYPGKPATGGIGPAPDFRFSLTGFFVFDRARYIRALVRGQVWDELRRQVVEEANLDTAFAIDPDGNYNPVSNDGLGDSCTLYQRWMSNFYSGETSRTAE